MASGIRILEPPPMMPSIVSTSSADFANALPASASLSSIAKPANSSMRQFLRREHQARGVEGPWESGDDGADSGRQWHMPGVAILGAGDGENSRLEIHVLPSQP